MDLMAMRRALLMAREGDDMTPWKTVTVDTNDWVNSSYATISRWATFLGIDLVDDLDDYVYFAIFLNNTATSYAAKYITWTHNSQGSTALVGVRADWSDVGSNNRSECASNGTIIKVYKIPRT